MATVADVQADLQLMQATVTTLQHQLDKAIADADSLAPTPPGKQESASGTKVTDTTGHIYDAALNDWTLVQGNGLEVYQNGAPAGYSANVEYLLYQDHTVYQTAGGGWWSWSGSGWADAQNPQPGPGPGPDPSPIPPDPAAIGPAVGARGFVDVDFAVKSGGTLQKSLFGSSMACDGGWNSLPDNWGNPQAQQAAYGTAGFGLPGMYVRINSENITINGDGSANNHAVDSTCQCLPKIMNVRDGTWTFGLGGTEDPSAFGRGAAAVARRFISNGLPCMEYEILNEMDGMDIGRYCDITNAAADALHGIDPKIKVIPTNDAWMHSDRMKTVAQRCGNRIARYHYHIYAVGPDRDDANAMSTGINRFRGDASGCRSTLQGTAGAQTPQGIGEYNMCGDPGAGERRQTTIYGAVWNLIGLYTAYTADPLCSHGAIWDWYGDGMYGLVIDPKSNPAGLPPYSVIPVGYGLKLCRQYLGGPTVRATTGSGRNMACLVSTVGNTFGALLINYDTGGATYSGTMTLSHWPVNSTGNGTITQWRLDGQHGVPVASQLTVTAGTVQLSLPGMSITVLTSTH